MTRARQLRDAFDGSFAIPVERSTPEELDLLAVRIGGDAYALRIAEIGSVYADRVITRAPSAAPSLIGLASLRGAIVPVFDLAMVLGYPQVTAPRWMVTVGPISFAFETLERHVRVGTTAIASQPWNPTTHTAEVVHVDGQLRSIVRLPSVSAAITLEER